MITINDLLDQGIEIQGRVQVREWSGTGVIEHYYGYWEQDTPHDSGDFDTEWMRTGIAYMYAVDMADDGMCLVIEIGRDEA